MKYNYVIFGQEWDLYKHIFSDLIELENVMYIANPKKKVLFITSVIEYTIQIRLTKL